MSTLTAEQRALGAANVREALGFSRRDFLKAAAVAPALGAFYFSYGKMEGREPVRAVLIGTGDEGCQAMVRDHNRDYVNYIGFCDIRPTQIERCKAEFGKHAQYTPKDVEAMRIYDDYQKAIADPDVEMVVIALPLFLHAPVAIEALKAGKHVFTEKLMAKTVAQCKDMIQVARANNRLLAVGHQRHYSTTYDNANHLIRQGYLGEIRHIRALWHRNNGQPIYARQGATLEYNDYGHARWSNPDAPLEYDATGNPVIVTGTRERNGVLSDGKPLYWDSWSRGIPEKDRGVDFAKHGYGSLHELIAWRLYSKYGAGLMAELGSHQLDACSIFLGKVHPLSVSGYGGKYHFRDNREVDDHVFAQFEFPALTVDGQPRDDERVIVTYSSICTNAYEKYGETVMGTLGTLVLEEEKDMYLFREGDRNHHDQHPRRQAGDGGFGQLVRRRHRLRDGLRRGRRRQAVPRLPRGTRTLRLVHPRRRPQKLHQPQRRKPQTPLPGRGRHGRCRHRLDLQHRHERRPTYRVQAGMVRRRLPRNPRRLQARTLRPLGQGLIAPLLEPCVIPQ